jgi:hypothetical protein
VSIGVGNENSRNHAPNENIHVQDYSDGIKHLAVILDRLNTRPQKSAGAVVAECAALAARPMSKQKAG